MNEQDKTQWLAIAIDRHAHGDLNGAEAVCRTILAADPAEATASHLLAVVACRQGRLAEGEALLRQVLQARPGDAQVAGHLIDALHGQGKLAESVLVAQEVLRHRPDDAPTHLRLAISFQEMGRLDEAVDAYAQALTRQPDLTDGFVNLAGALHRLGHLNDAAAALMRALEQDPQSAPAYLILGNVLCDQDRCDDALLAYDHALQRRPGWADALTNRALALIRLGRLDEAVAWGRRAVDSDPRHGPAWTNLGQALQALGQRDAAVAAFETAAALQPDDAMVLSNLAQALCGQGQSERSLELHQRAVAADPTKAVVYYNWGLALQDAKRWDQAEAAFVKAATLGPDQPEPYIGLANLLHGRERLGLAMRPIRPAGQDRSGWPAGLADGPPFSLADGEDPVLALYRQAITLQSDHGPAHFNLGAVLLRRGQYREGWREYGWRFRGGIEHLRPRGFSQPEWTGENFSGKTLLLHAEQGLGDTIQFVRFAALAAARGGRVVLEVQPALHALLAATPGVDMVVAAGQALPDFDLHLPLMSLPGVLDLPEGAFAQSVPYVAVDPGLAAAWRARLSGPGLAVGLVWSGNPNHQGDRWRSVAAATMLAALAPLPVRLFSLQKDVRDSDRAALAAHGGRVVDLGDALTDFSVTAAIVSSLDLLITIDTAMAHLGGALGCPTWALLSAIADWRWGIGREDSPWYPSMRLFRQAGIGDWDDVLGRVAAALGERAAIPAGG